MFRKYSWIVVMVAVVLSLFAPRPAAALAANGPWLVYSAKDANDPQSAYANQLWVANADGSGAKMVDQGKIILDFVADHTGGIVAYITSEYPQHTMEPAKLALNLLTLPDLKTKVITPLINAKTDSTESDRNEIVEAMDMGQSTDQWSMQWSPDGQTLAFIGAQGGTSADLYTYSLATNKVTQLSSGASQAISPSWSPDGKYIVHLGVDGFGTGAGWAMAGVWAAKADNSGITTLYKPEGGGEGLLGWTDSASFLAWTWKIDCGKTNIRAFNITTKKQDVWFPGYFEGAAWSPENQALLVGTQKCMDKGLDSGLYIVTAGQRKPRLIAESGVPLMKWSPELGKFIIQGEGFSTVTPNGEIADLAIDGLTVMPVVSPDGARLAWADGKALTVSNVDGSNLSQIAELANKVVWAP